MVTVGKRRILDHASEHQGQALGLDDLGLGAGFAQVGAGEVGAAAHVRVAVGLHADRGNADQRRELVREFLAQLGDGVAQLGLACRWFRMSRRFFTAE